MADKTNATDFLELDTELYQRQDADDFLSSPIETEPTATEQSGERTDTTLNIQTPDILKAEDIPSGQDFWKGVKATPEVADLLATGFAQFFPSIGAKMTRTAAGEFMDETPEETKKAAGEWARETGTFINLMLHPGSEVSELRQTSEAAEPAKEVVHKAFQAPREYLGKPMGDFYTWLTGSERGGQLATDATELLFYVGLMPKMKEYGKAKITKAKSRAAKAKQKATATEDIRQSEQVTRQQVYDKLFTEDNVKKFVDDVKRYTERKAKGESPQVSRAEVETLYDNWVNRMKEEVPDLRKNLENWQAEKLRLDAEGIEPAGELFRGFQVGTGVPERGKLLDSMDLKFGVETNKPFVPETRGQPYSLFERARGTERGKVPSKEEFKAVQESTATTTKVEDQGTALMEMGETILRDLEGKGIDTSRAEFAPGPESVTEAKMEMSGFKEYAPPATEQAFEMSQSGLVARERMLREVVNRKKRAAESDELSKLMEEQKKDLEGKDPAEVDTLSLEELRHMEDTYDYLTERWEPESDSAFRESLQWETPRRVDEMLEDWKLVDEGGWRSERGSISFEKLNEQQRAAIKRLTKDIQVIKRNAARYGKKISDYLIDAGFTRDSDIARYIEENAERVVKDEHTKVDIDTTGVDPSRVTKMYDRLEEANRRSGVTLKDAWSEIAKKGWANDHDVRAVLEPNPSQEASAALNNKINAKGANAWADHYFRDVQQKIFGHLSGHERRSVDRLVHATNLLDIARRHGGLKRATREKVTTREVASFVENFQRERKLSDESFARVKQAADDYFNVMRDMLRTKYEEGAIPKWLYELLDQNRYSPIRYFETAEAGDILQSKAGSLETRRIPKDVDELRTMVREEVGSDQFDVKSSEIRELAGGKQGIEKLNSEELLSAVVAETSNWVMKNRVTKSLGKFAENVDNPYVKPGKIKNEWVDNQGNARKSYYTAPEGMKELHYFENGERKTIYAQDWFANQWASSSPEMTNTLAGFTRAATLSGAARTFATGAGHPSFFIVGHPMDVFTVFRNAQKRMPNGKYKGVYSPFLPKFLGQFYNDMRRVAPDVISQKGRYVEGIKEGLMQNWLTEGGQPTFRRMKARRGPVGAARKGLEGIRNVGSYLNRLSEELSRYAVRERMIREGYDGTASTAAARDYLDYAQGGSISKAVDNGMPYFNVATQAVRTSARATKRNWADTTLRDAQLMALASGFYMLMRSRDEKAMEQSSDYIKNNYFLAPTGWKLKDDYGNEHRISFKIRKEPAVAPIFTGAELATAAAFQDEVEFDRLWKSLLTPAPRIGTASVPSFAAGIAYSMNKNPYFFNDIWTKGNVEAHEEWDEDVHQFFRDVGQNTGMSPARLQAATKQVLGDGNIWGDIAGAGYDWMRDGLGEEEHEMVAADMILDGWGSEALHVTSEPDMFWDLRDELDKEERTKRVAQNRKLDKFARGYYIEGDVEFDKIADFISKQPRDDQKRLQGRLKDFVYTQDLPRRNMWMGPIRSISTPEARAKAVVRWMNEVDQEGREEIQMGLQRLKNSPSSIIPKDINSKFWKTLHREMSASSEE